MFFQAVVLRCYKGVELCTCTHDPWPGRALALLLSNAYKQNLVSQDCEMRCSRVAVVD